MGMLGTTRPTKLIRSGFKPASGAELTGPASYRFNTGGPFVRSHWPSYGKIDEEQIFLLQLNGPATPESVQSNLWCAADGVGERIPVKPVTGEQREALLKARGYEEAAKKEPLRFLTLQCNRTLTPGGRVQLVYGKGVATPGGIANSVERKFNFEVREPFSASFTCERENAQAACLPIRPMALTFNAPVSRKLAEQIRLKSAKGDFKPTFSVD